MTYVPVHIVADRFVARCLPEDFDSGSAWDVTIERRGPHSWAVCHAGFCYDADGCAEYEPSPSNRDEAFLAKFRMRLIEAKIVAERLAPTIVVNGMTPAQVYEKATSLLLSDLGAAPEGAQWDRAPGS